MGLCTVKSSPDPATAFQVALTEKGKGVPGSEERYDRAHAAKPKPKAAKVPVEPAVLQPMVPEKPKGRAWTKWFSESIERLAEHNNKVIAITAAMPDGTGLMDFRERFPDRFVDSGIAEQHAVAMASGMATAGMKPVCAIYSTFLQRGYDQVFQEVVLQRLPVVFAMDRAGLVGAPSDCPAGRRRPSKRRGGRWTCSRPDVHAGDVS